MKVASRLDAIVATLVGVMALLVSGYTALVQRQQVRAQVWPYVTISYGNSPIHIDIENKGVGPALIKNVIVRVDGKPVPTWAALLIRAGMTDAHDIGYSTFHRSVISPGESVHAFRPHDEKGDDLYPKPGYGLRLQSALQHSTFEICYCSTLDECWTVTDDDETIPVKRCPSPSDDSFHQ